MASSLVTKEIESRLKQNPQHLFEVFLEIREPIGNEPPAVLIQYPDDYNDQILRLVANFAYPSPIPTDEQSEHFTFVTLDSTGFIFRFGYCRRSNRESTCLCLISYFPWFETFYSILNDLSQIINTKSFNDVESFLSSLHKYKLLSNEDFHRNNAQETINIFCCSRDYRYFRPDQRKLPSKLSNGNFSVMFSRLGPDIMLRLFTHLIFERRILFVSSKLFHLTACACGCLELIRPMHWQSHFLPILPESLSATVQCTTPFIIGVHSSVYSKLNRKELGDVIIVNIDETKLESPHDDLSLFPKDLIRSMKKGIEQSSQMIGDHLARVFLRAMAFIIGNYDRGFTIKNDKLDFDRNTFLQPYADSSIYSFMSSIANTQMFEQFSRYRAYLQLERSDEIDEFDIEVKNFQHVQQSKKPIGNDVFSKLKSNKKLSKILEKTTNPLIEQVQDKTEQIQTMMNKIGFKGANAALASVRNTLTSISTDQNLLSIPQNSAVQSSEEKSDQSSRSSTPESFSQSDEQLIDLKEEENLLLPSPVILNVITTPEAPPPARSVLQTNAKIKQSQSELQYKIQNFDKPRFETPQELSEQSRRVKTLVQQFDPLDAERISPLNSFALCSDDLSSSNGISTHRQTSPNTIPNNHVNQILQTIQTNYGTGNRLTTNSSLSQLPTSTDANSSDLINLN